jgi:hypothetical protein
MSDIARDHATYGGPPQLEKLDSMWLTVPKEAKLVN